MDLLATVRKDGPRGGRGDFKWSDVQGSSHRENYLGHSLMAPVGRWQRGKDLNWYAKADADASNGDNPAERAARERKEEIRRIKEAEEDALARALGFDVAPRNPNMEALSDKREVEKVLREAAADEDEDNAKGVGFGRSGGRLGPQQQHSDDRIEGTLPSALSGGVECKLQQRRRDRSRKRRRRSRSIERARDLEKGRYRCHDRDHGTRRKSRSREKYHRSHFTSRSRSRDRRREGRQYGGDREHRTDLSLSPYRRRDDRRSYDKRR